MTALRGDARNARERRAMFRALAVDPRYRPLATWTCPICRRENPRSATRCGYCSSMGPAWTEIPSTSRRDALGQAIVEFALVLPIMLLAALGFTEGAFLMGAKEDQDRATSVVAIWAANHPSEDWHAVANGLLPGCDVTLDESGPAHDLLTVTSTCTYHPKITSNLWDGLPISSTEAASIVPVAVPTPVPS